jgi:hypothetical protein
MAKAAAEGIRYQPGGILATTTTVTIFIDMFIGVWTFILGYNLDQLHRQKGPDKVKPSRVPLPNLRLTNLGDVGAGKNEPRLNFIWQ